MNRMLSAAPYLTARTHGSKKWTHDISMCTAVLLASASHSILLTDDCEQKQQLFLQDMRKGQIYRDHRRGQR